MFSRGVAYGFLIFFVSQVVAAQDTKSDSEQNTQVQDNLEKEEQKPPEVQPPIDQASPQPIPKQTQKTLYPRHLAIGIATLKELGLAAGEIRFRWNYIGADAAFGWMPIFIMVNYNLDNKFIFDFSLHATASLLLFFSNDQTSNSNGIRLGGVYDTIFGWGAIFGWQEEVIVNRWLSLQWGAGLQAYPGGDSRDWAKEKIRREFPGASNIEVNPIFSYVQIYIGFGLLFYLF